MQRIRAEITRAVLTPPVAAILCLTFLTWYVAELSNGFFADVSFTVSLALAVAVGFCALSLARELEREKARRRAAEALLHARQSGTGRERGAESPPAALLPADSVRFGRLTLREREVLGLVAHGWTNAQIGTELNISLNTVERHTANIYRKLEVRGRVEAAAHVLRHEREQLDGPPQNPQHPAPPR